MQLVLLHQLNKGSPDLCRFFPEKALLQQKAFWQLIQGVNSQIEIHKKKKRLLEACQHRMYNKGFQLRVFKVCNAAVIIQLCRARAVVRIPCCKKENRKDWMRRCSSDRLHV